LVAATSVASVSVGFVPGVEADGREIKLSNGDGGEGTDRFSSSRVWVLYVKRRGWFVIF
jgi:hypothetical protein